MLLKGILKNIIPIYPLGSLRKIHLLSPNGDLYLTAHWKTLEKQQKNIKLGDKIEINYKKFDEFIMNKI